jgi:hypothetical protein
MDIELILVRSLEHQRSSVFISGQCSSAVSVLRQRYLVSGHGEPDLFVIDDLVYTGETAPTTTFPFPYQQGVER